jgi:hypothetical protein
MSELSSKHEEVYLFGLASLSIRKRLLDLRALAVHVTSERIFVLYAPTWMQITIFAYLGLGILFLAIGLWNLFPVVTGQTETGTSYSFWSLWFLLFLDFAGLYIFGDFKRSSRLSIAELERRKLFSIEKNQISKVVYKGKYFPRSGGSIKIISETGERFDLSFASSGSYDLVRRAFRLFFAPEANYLASDWSETQTALKYKFCYRCGSMIPGESSFCKKCGAQV